MNLPGQSGPSPRGPAPSAPPVAERVHVRAPDERIGPGELWEFRDLLYFLTWRDVKVRYAQSVMGFGWAVAQPLLMMGLFTLVLGVLAKVPSPDGPPYAVFVLCGLVPWTFFANAVGSASESLVGSANLVGKVYFPRLVVPLASMVAWVPDLGVAMVLLAVAMAVFTVAPTAAVLALPLFILLAVVAAAAAGLWVSALHVAYRDVKYAVPFLLQLGLFATPVVYSADLVPEEIRPLYGLNPMVSVVEGFRWALLGTPAPDWAMMAVSTVMVLVVLITGLRYFSSVERYFADVI